jgi:hypothetical protein
MKKCKKEDRKLHNLGKEIVLQFNNTGNVTMRRLRINIFAVEKQ